MHLFEDGRCYSHHASDPLNDGHAHDAFSVFCILAHGGNVTAAVKAAAESLGLPLPDCSIQVSQKTLTLTRKWPDPPAQEAFHGLTGEFVRLVAPHAEADDMALVSQFNTMFGNVSGPNAYYQVERDRHFAKLFSNLVGETAKARKGTSHGQARYPFEKIDPDWARKRMLGGLSSGEELISEVRDPIFRREPEKQNGKATGNYIDTEIDPGVADKRLLVYEPEFASVLKVMGRDGNTLSDVIRKAWDSPELRTLTKNSPVHATGAHISIINSITADELRRYLDRTEMANGFGNRFLWICVKRSKLLPHGGQIDRVDFGPFTQMLQAAVTFARGAGQITMTPAAAEMWTGVYEPLSEGKPGLTGALLARGEVQVIRMAMIYALMDMAHQIDTVHLEAALAKLEAAMIKEGWIDPEDLAG